MSPLSALFYMVGVFIVGLFAGLWIGWGHGYDTGWHEGWNKQRKREWFFKQEPRS